MRKVLSFGLAIALGCVALVSAGYAQTANPVGEAIQNSQAFKTVAGKVAYLMNQAAELYGSKQFQQAIEVAQYVLNNLDKSSQPAQDLIAKAKAQLQAAAQKAAGDVTGKFFGK